MQKVINFLEAHINGKAILQDEDRPSTDEMLAASWVLSHYQSSVDVDHIRVGKAPLTNLEILLLALGEQGGTVIEVARRLMVTPGTIIEATPDMLRDLCRTAQRVRMMP